MTHYTQEQWDTEYEELEFRRKLCSCSTFLVSTDFNGRLVLKAGTSKETVDIEAELMMDDLPEYISANKEGSHQGDEYVFENVFFYDEKSRPETMLSGTGLTDRDGSVGTALADALALVPPLRTVRFRHCLFCSWPLPTTLNFDIVFDHCLFDGDSISSDVLFHSISFEMCVIRDAFRIVSCKVSGILKFTSTVITGLETTESELEGLVFRDSESTCGISLYGVSISDHMIISHSILHHGISMQDARANGPCRIIGSYISETADLSRSTFGQDLVLSLPEQSITIYDQLFLNDIRVIGKVSIVSSECNNLTAARIDAHDLDLTGTSVDGDLIARGSSIAADLMLRSVRVGVEADLNSVSIGRVVDATGASFANLRLDRARVGIIQMNDFRAVDLNLDWSTATILHIEPSHECFFRKLSLRHVIIDKQLTMTDIRFDTHGPGLSSEDAPKAECPLIDLSYSTFKGSGVTSTISIDDADDSVEIDLRGVETAGRLEIRGLTFYRSLRRVTKPALVRICEFFRALLLKLGMNCQWKAWFRLTGNRRNKDLFFNLHKDDWNGLREQWAALEGIYRNRDEPELCKDAHVWRCFCERMALSEAAADRRSEKKNKKKAEKEAKVNVADPQSRPVRLVPHQLQRDQPLAGPVLDHRLHRHVHADILVRRIRTLRRSLVLPQYDRAPGSR